MPQISQPTDTGPVMTREGFLLGCRLMMPVLPSLMVYGLAFGAASAGRGLTVWQSLGMSAFVYAGASQMVALEVWRSGWDAAGLFTVAIVTAAVNARFVLMSASLQPWMKGAPPTQTGVQLFFLVDASWVIAMRYHGEGGRDLGVVFGAGVLSWVMWIAITAPGYLAGAVVPDPRRFALDLVMPIFFAAMAVPLWRGVLRSGLPWLVAASVALAVQWLVPGYLFIVAGAVAGALSGAAIHDRA